MKIRNINQEDTPEITEIFLRTYSKEPWKEDWDKKIAQDRITDLASNKAGQNLCVINEENKILAVLFGRRSYYIRSKELFVDELFVDSDFQNQGVGKFLIAESSKIVKNLGYSCIVLNTEKSFPSEFFYLKNGFTRKESNIFMYKEI